ncbi:hypothetical protein N0V90_004252 [Kalmusia sp. IMI 367209]|nr:hypothetical protein N0V90_004252 [Kalmusia sp. IMI 367209]
MSFNQKEYLALGLKPGGGLRHIDAMVHILGIQPSIYISALGDDVLQNAVVIVTDLEFYESCHKYTTEIGITSVLVSSLRQAISGSPIHPLSSMEIHHMRIKENAHLVNGRRVAGHPEDFRFGATGFVTMEEAQQALFQLFQQYDEKKALRPVVIMGHDVDNDIEGLKERVGVDLSALGVISMTLDTQRMAKELGLANHKPHGKLSLKDTLALYSITEPYLHNAGNDAFHTMDVACLLAIDNGTGRGRYQKENQVGMF